MLISRALLPVVAIIASFMLTVADPAICAGQSLSDTSHIPESAVGGAVFFPSQGLTSEAMELFPREVVTAAGEQQFGIDPMRIREVVMLVDQPTRDEAPGWGAIIRFEEAVFPGGEMFEYGVEPYELDGRRAWSAYPDFSIVEVDRTTWLVGSEMMLQKMLNADGVETRLVQLLRDNADPMQLVIALDIEPVRGLFQSLVDEIPDVPAPLARFLEIPELLDTFVLKQDLNIEMTSRLMLTATAGNGDKLAGLIRDGLAMAKEWMLRMAETEMQSDDPVQKAALRYFYRLGDFVERALQPNVDGDTLTYETGYGMAAAPVAIALLLPAVQQVRVAARRTESANNLRMMILGMHSYHDAFRKLPTNVYAEDGTPLLSWRVQILPFIEQQHLYDQFRLDEPWDSEHNLPLSEQMPAIFGCPSYPLEAGKTICLAVSGPNTVFDGTPKAKRLESIYDGTSRTIALVEANPDQSVIWTKPEDFVPDFENPSRGLGALYPSGFNAALFDGSVRTISMTVDWETLLMLFQPSDGGTPWLD